MVEHVRKDPASSRKERGFIYAYDLFRKGEIEKSLATWQLLLEKKNNAKEKGLIYGQMGRCYLLLGEVEKALDAYQSARKYHNSYLANQGLYDVYAAMGKPKRAKQAQRKAQKAKNKALKQARAMTDVLLSEHAFQEGLDKCYEALSYAPHDASLLYKRGLIYEFMQYPFPLVDSMYNQVLAVDPAYTPVYHRKSMLYMKQKKHEKAHIYIDKAIEKVPNNVYYNYTKGKIYLQEKDYSLAYSYFNVARLINKNIAAIYMGLCESLLGTSIQHEIGRQQNLIQANSYCNTGLTLLHRARKLQLEQESDFSDIGSEISSLLEEVSVEEAMVRIKDFMRQIKAMSL